MRSLSWPKNSVALKNAHWDIYGDLEQTQQVYEIATKVLPFNQITLRQKRMDRGGVDLLGCMMETMRRCADDRSAMITAPPDTVFSDGSIDALLAYGDQPGTCVAVPHPRVLPDILTSLGPEPLPNDKLVTLALEKYPHRSWVTGDRRLSVNGTHVGGLSWIKTGNVWAVTHRLPTVYLSNFNEEDRKFFSRPYQGQQPQYGMWDHEWPGQCLLPHQRQRTIGSSDLAFIFELTEHYKNIPTQRLVSVDEPDAFHRDEPHNRINRCYTTVFRGAQ